MMAGLPAWYIGLLALFNVFWFATYALVIRRGTLDRMAGVPLFALTLNLAWDATGAFVIRSPTPQEYIDIAFLAINAYITLQWFRYWKNDFRTLGTGAFWFYWSYAQIAAFFIIILGNAELGDVLMFKMGFIDNFVNSALFLAMLYRRPLLEGQSLYIGLCKLLGTGSVSLASWLRPWPGTGGSAILPPLFLGILILDIAYVVEYGRKARRLGIDPWRRW